ncbi:UDP-N-acetylglucosamine 2-epimerase [Seleniivibrio woodruffii]|uniref:GDP/UDP-N,N'-diacetylbacillosamine 2-epimerase (Hydrolysing) n=1 Tax=Seleniivibrio woodruffii TaxID=1078050 RepID=A0A4R1K9T8_9BACT|nr:UDP-N-acetylglucosamine 2-epimerase [Seleniivibrio woodruffii]TCK59939.1 GDP/UDP-N,N'-diacetylbacillosamine 2-epimerase (hydrolysing) [Seleniivibrio woodruffii]TVZ35840.1 GDP/UDP-N,N'-diacetylbacillosamine 2-epimerase (hydrolysing) [Seleniivibrio woodruffii]
MRRICAVTGGRADYYLMRNLLKGIEAAAELELSVIATGSHLSPAHGMTVDAVEEDFPDVHRIDLQLGGDSPSDITKTTGRAMIAFADALETIKSDILLVLGDRYEIFAAVTAALIAGIPVAHLHGGETTEGAADEAFRHSITKMSHLHFTAAEDYRRRVIQLGEDPARVFNVGGMGAAAISRMKLMEREELEKSLGFGLGDKYIVVTFHPVTLDSTPEEEQLGQLLRALDRFDGKIIFTGANADAGGTVINRMLAEYVANSGGRAAAFDSLGMQRYLSAVRHAYAVVGNSSSGLAEAPSLKTPTINIGCRQAGRLRAQSVIDCEPAAESILAAFKKIDTPEFQKILTETVNPYGEGDNTAKIVEILANFPLKDIIIKKFHDIGGLK